MILNILLIIILLVISFRIFYKYNMESYQNPFIYDSNPIINNYSYLSYTPLPYISDDVSLKSEIIKDRFINKNNQLILEYADNNNYTINTDLSSVKLLLPTNNLLVNKYINNKCLGVDSNNSNRLIMANCDLSDNTQLWSLINDKLSILNQTKCINYNSENIIDISNCLQNSTEKEWIPDTKNRIHSINNYSNCLTVNNINNISLLPCSNTDKQVWTIKK